MALNDNEYCGVHLQRVLDMAAAERVGRQSDASGHFLQMMDRAFLRDMFETTVPESVATRQLIHREAPLERGT